MNCCPKNNEKTKKEGFLAGLIYGLMPHIGCIGFIIFAVLGVTAATALFKPLLLSPYFFYILVVLSIVFATISAFFYFKRQGLIILNRDRDGWEFSFLLSGIKRKWKYLLTLYGTTIAINLILFMVIFPVLTTLDTEEGLSLTAVANVFFDREPPIGNSLPSMTLRVDIPCPGHALLITGELRIIEGVENVSYRFPNKFIVNYNPEKTSEAEMLGLDVFKTYKPTVVN